MFAGALLILVYLDNKTILLYNALLLYPVDGSSIRPYAILTIHIFNKNYTMSITKV